MGSKPHLGLPEYDRATTLRPHHLLGWTFVLICGSAATYAVPSLSQGVSPCATHDIPQVKGVTAYRLPAPA